jgi:hypothetical protein
MIVKLLIVLLVFRKSFYGVIIRSLMNWCLASIGIVAWFDNIDVLGRNNLIIIGSIGCNNYAIHLLQTSMEYFMASEIDSNKAFLSISYKKSLNNFFWKF